MNQILKDIINKYDTIEKIAQNTHYVFKFEDRYNRNTNPYNERIENTKKFIPNNSIYIMHFENNNDIYVGQSNNTRNRILDYGQKNYQIARGNTIIVKYIKKYEQFCKVYIIKLPQITNKDELNIIEESLIEKLNATINVEKFPTRPTVRLNNTSKPKYEKRKDGK